MPISEKRLAANRANAAKSTGPTSSTGKPNSARNSTRHGILANTTLIENESRERFVALVNAFNADFQPANHTERLLVEKMAVCHWRLFRLWAIEAAGIIHETPHQADSTTEYNPPTRAMLALRALGDNDRHVDLMGRYEHRYDRQYCRALEALTRLQDAQKEQKNTPVPHEPIHPAENKRPPQTVEPAATTVEANQATIEPSDQGIEPTQ
jgi:hypothetical protein